MRLRWQIISPCPFFSLFFSPVSFAPCFSPRRSPGGPFFSSPSPLLTSLRAVAFCSWKRDHTPSLACDGAPISQTPTTYLTFLQDVGKKNERRDHSTRGLFPRCIITWATIDKNSKHLLSLSSGEGMKRRDHSTNTGHGAREERALSREDTHHDRLPLLFSLGRHG